MHKKCGLIFSLFSLSSFSLFYWISLLILSSSATGVGLSSNNNNNSERGGGGGSNLSINSGYNISFIDQLDKKCSFYCSDLAQFTSCNQGCKNWKTGLSDGCGVVCNGSESNFRELYACQRGCSKIIEEYYYRVTGYLGELLNLDPPTLVSNSLKSTSLGLNLTRSSLNKERLPYLAYSIQQRYYRRNERGWGDSIPFQQLNSTTNISTVISLKPYTEYQFRIGFILAIDLPPVYSFPSNPIETLSHGHISNPPEITSIQPISNSSISITWRRPSRPNARLLAYILKLQKIPNGHAIIKEIRIFNNSRYEGYTFSGLEPNTNYSLQLSAQSSEGEGQVKSIYFMTPKILISNEISKRQEPKLLIQGLKDIYTQHLDVLMDPDVTIYSSTVNITSMAAHFKYKWVFISTSDGEVLRTGMDRNQTIVILGRERLDIWVSFMSVDWLNEKLYLVGRLKSSSSWCIKRCDLNGANLQTIYSLLNKIPIDFMANPYTGYLFWTVNSSSLAGGGGLYKLDLISDDSIPVKILEAPDLGPFTFDYLNLKILIVQRARNSILSVSLDGDAIDIRSQNTQSPQFRNVLSIAYYGGIFYWTTGENIMNEEYNRAENIYFHNSVAISKSHQFCSKIFIVHPDNQPIPVPRAPPKNLQVVFGQNNARVSWESPFNIPSLGEGSWKDWKYNIIISGNTTSSNISSTVIIIDYLQPDTFYVIQVSAYSPNGGQGPISPPFRGKTLKASQINTTFLWASEDGVYSSTVLGENVQKVILPIHWESPQRSWTKEPSLINSLDWHGSSIFYTTTNGSVFRFDEKKRTSYRFSSIAYGQSVAYDFIGNKLYWSNPKAQAIKRCSLNYDRSDCDPDKVDWLQVITIAKEIVIDSGKGLIFWNTGHSLESAWLNGFSHSVLYEIGIFSGVQIVGLTLDSGPSSKLYWITRSSDLSSIYTLSYSSIIKTKEAPLLLYTFEETASGPIQYFNDRLIWLQGKSEAAILELSPKGNKAATLSIETLNNLTSLHVVNDSGPSKYSHLARFKAIPNSVRDWSVNITGKWNNFTVSWQPVNGNITSYEKIYYEVSIKDINDPRKTLNSNLTLYPNITIADEALFDPYSEIEISIVSITYWANSKPTIVIKHTPSWKPTEPKNVRIFVQKSNFPYTINNVNISAEIRWDAPLKSNGRIIGYLVHCWKNSIKNECHCPVDMKMNSCQLSNLTKETIYEVSVQAFTDAGVGTMSNKASTNTAYNSNPIPKLLVGSFDKLQILDIDRNDLKNVPLGHLSPITATYLASEDAVFWINEGQDLMKYGLSSRNKTRILTLNDMEASQLTIDWIGLKLFWSFELKKSTAGEEGKIENIDEKFGIMSLDLTAVGVKKNPKIVVKSRTPIKSIAVNPYKNSLIWSTSRRTGFTSLVTAKTDGSNIVPFLSRDPSYCNCSTVSKTGEAIAFDPNPFGSLKNGILFTDMDSIYYSDEMGCLCFQIVNMTLNSFSRPLSQPFRIVADGNHVFWSSNYLFATEKTGNSGITELMPNGVHDIAPISYHSQPFPELNCLIPKKLQPNLPTLFNHSSHSLHLLLPKVKTRNCSSLPELSMASPLFSVFYGTVDEKGITKCTPTSQSFCKIVRVSSSSLATSLSPELLHITDLTPYTTYNVFLQVSNIYSEKEKLEPLTSSPTMFRTAPGAPLPPKLLRLEPLTPVSVKVVWLSPDKLNGEKVWYEVHWRIQSNSAVINPSFPRSMKTNSNRNGETWAVTETKSNPNKTEYHFDIDCLIPSSNYSIWVRAFSEKGDAFSESESRTVITFDSPNNITLISATPHVLQLAWDPPKDTSILSHQIMYRQGWNSYWNSTEIVNFTIPGIKYNFTISNLKPKTHYGFRIKSWYSGNPMEPIIWPIEGQFNMETLADKPGQPGQPIARGIGKSLYEISWKKSEDNGAIVELYSLEYKIRQEIIFEETGFPDNAFSIRKKREGTGAAGKFPEFADKLISNDKSINNRKRVSLYSWEIIYNGTEPRWQVKGLEMNAGYIFRVRAKNLYGWGSYSKSSTVTLSSLIVRAEQTHIGVILGTVSLAIFILGIFAILFIYFYRQKLKEKPALISPLTSERREVELATLRELPTGPSFTHQSNVLYAGNEILMDFDLHGIPTVTFNQVSFKKFLGSGAFGEVYEGIASNIPGINNENNDVPVAIKTLKKGATNKEKREFLKEAKLMSEFRHPHILQLMGVCIDNDPFLLLELMDGGDLLSYLQMHRPNAGTPQGLTLNDLVRMCVDIAKGCVYLEEMHFVHRDLAARNALVRNARDGGRMVKIGDFGLTRDIYSNDYYRNARGGMLPVRWMSPESLIDGVYSTQSDIWSFAVLLWEILTMGQKPYPGRSNMEVLEHVRAGGRLHYPQYTPTRLANLMLQCWEFNPENRPSFRDCLTQIELQLLFQNEESLDANDTIQYVYREDEIKEIYIPPRNGENDSVFSFPANPPSTIEEIQSGDENYREREGMVDEATNFPKYLEVLSDSRGSPGPVFNSYPSSLHHHHHQNHNQNHPPPPLNEDGYEIPLPKMPPRRAPEETFSFIGTSNNRFPLLNDIASQIEYKNICRGLLASSSTDEHEHEQEGSASGGCVQNSLSLRVGVGVGNHSNNNNLPLLYDGFPYNNNNHHQPILCAGGMRVINNKNYNRHFFHNSISSNSSNSEMSSGALLGGLGLPSPAEYSTFNQSNFNNHLIRNNSRTCVNNSG